MIAPVYAAFWLVIMTSSGFGFTIDHEVTVLPMENREFCGEQLELVKHMMRVDKAYCIAGIDLPKP